MAAIFTDSRSPIFVPLLLLCCLYNEVNGLQCLECPETYSPEDCSMTGICGRDEICFTRSFINFRDRLAFRLGCEDKDVCDLYNLTGPILGKRADSINHCRQCCTSDNCNVFLCKDHVFMSTTTTAPSTTTKPSTAKQSTTTTHSVATPIVIGNLSQDCKAYLDSGNNVSGIYLVTPPGLAQAKVFCDMTTYGGGWMVIQRRVNGSVSFNKTWEEYKQGFGSLNGNFWIGNEFLHQVTTEPGVNYTLRFDLTMENGTTAYAMYRDFYLSEERDAYTLHFNQYLGDAGDSFLYHRGMKFSTPGHDNDAGRQDCAGLYGAGWWYKDCYNVNINGEYGQHGDTGLVWYDLTQWTGALTATTMSIRRQGY